MIEEQERRPLRGGVQRLGGALDEQFRRTLRTAIASIVKVGIDALDVLDGDADLEPNGDEELTGDERDASFTEWTSRGRNKDVLRATAETAEALWSEDDEDSDPCEDDDPAGGAVDDEPHDQEHDAEIEQMHDDIPSPPVYALEPNPFDDKRPYLGRNCSNPAAFVGNLNPVRFA